MNSRHAADAGLIEPAACTGVSRRPFEDGDLDFLYQVYASSRAAEMALLTDWSEAQKVAFLRAQFHAQHTHYQTHYPDARYDVLVRDGTDIGRLYVARMHHEIRVMDIALMPAYRNQGIGRTLMQVLMDEAASVGKFVSLHVEASNPAKRLYDRLGFTVVGEVTFYKRMYWVPEGVMPVLNPAAAVPSADVLS